MYLRNIKITDAEFMLEWMHDKDIVLFMHSDFMVMTIDNVYSFINTESKKDNTINFAIASDNDEYMGTVSLKHIDWDNKEAEIALVVRKVAFGHGYSWFGLEEIIKYAFYEMGLKRVYWCVSEQNFRAIRFYEKHNYHQSCDISQDIKQRYGKLDKLKWYSVRKGDEIDTRDYVAGCKVIRIKTIHTVNAGELLFFEGTHDIPFDIKRIYYISKVPEGVRRGFHAHKELKQFLFCPYGRIQLILESHKGREEIELSDPSIGIIIEQCTWREMLWLQKDSVLCVAASDFYKEDDYIRDYKEFCQFIKSK